MCQGLGCTIHTPWLAHPDQSSGMFEVKCKSHEWLFTRLTRVDYHQMSSKLEWRSTNFANPEKKSHMTNMYCFTVREYPPSRGRTRT